jgi:hypothetical protein
VRCAPLVVAAMFFGCSSSDSGPTTVPDAGSSPEASTPVDAGDPTVTPYSLAVAADNPLLYWRLDEKSGTVARDRTASKLDGIYSADGVELGQPSLVRDKNLSVRLIAPGSVDGPLDAKLAFVGTAPFSIECWLAFTAPPTEIETIVSRASEAKATGYSMWLDPQGGGVRAYFGRYEANVGATVSSSEASPLAVGTTYHLVGVYDGAKLMLYVDGVSTETPTTTALTDGAYRVRVGHSEDTAPKLLARIDEVAIYGTALSKARIEAHRDIGRTDNN